MINKVKRILIGHALRKKAMDRIPRSGSDGERVDCYVITLHENDRPVLLVDSISKFGYSGRYWDNRSFSKECIIPFNLSLGLNIRIEHFYGLIDFKYPDLFSYFINEYTKLFIIKKLFYSIKSKVPQFFFNRKRVIIPERMRLLELLIEYQSLTPDEPINANAMLTYMYSSRWYFHPNFLSLRQKMNIYLSSLAETGELKVVKGGYMITGRAIATLEQYRIEKNRAIDAQKNQSWMLKLTILLTIFTAFQAGLFKSPILLDFGELYTIIIGWFKSM